MRKILLATAASLATVISAHAADLPMPQVMVYVPPAFNWTGIYIGGHVGASTPQRAWNDTLYGIDFTSGTRDVFVGGTQFGANFQFDRFVVGIEWDLDYMKNNSNYDDGVLIPALGHRILVSSSNHWSSSLAGRFGVAFDRVLLYGKAGVGFVGNSWITITDQTTGGSITGSNNMTTGWLGGLGVEWAFGEFINTWTMKLEYNYLGVGSWTYTVPTTSKFLAGDTFSANRDVQTLKLGFNFLFNGPNRNKYY